MALRALILRKKADTKRAELETLRAKDADFEKREAELQQAVEEITEETSEEDKTAVEAAVEEFDTEKKEHEDKKADLEGEIEKIEENIKADEAQQRSVSGKPEKRGEKKTIMNRRKFFGMDMQERDAFFADEEVKGFIENVRTCIREKRAIGNVGLIIPDVALPLIKQKVTEGSKLIKYVNVKYVTGTSRQNIMGEIPEGFWDDMCASLKEMDLAFYGMEADGYKVSGYFAVANAILEDNDVNLMAEIIEATGKALAKALDKAIIYGKGIKMPMGIVTSLKANTAPDTYPAKGRPWKDLSVSNVVTGSAATGVKLFQEIVKASGVIDNDYDTGSIVWMMNRKTRTKLLSESMGVNMAAAIAAGMGDEMPVVGGKIEEFKYIPDDTVIFGYMKNYNLIERSGTKVEQSEHVRFLEDQTVFRGTARYDGEPVIREAFAIYGIGKAPDLKAPLFAGETAPQE